MTQVDNSQIKFFYDTMSHNYDSQIILISMSQKSVKLILQITNCSRIQTYLLTISTIQIWLKILKSPRKRKWLLLVLVWLEPIWRTIFRRVAISMLLFLRKSLKTQLGRHSETLVKFHSKKVKNNKSYYNRFTTGVRHHRPRVTHYTP